MARRVGVLGGGGAARPTIEEAGAAYLNAAALAGNSDRS